ncbi:hypothetical protein O6H91_Y225900 [Diphasiastrum complanatum]|nr:hypothetical protein O6H91_Y225900 [Diphasiastrum complanatum]
MKSKPLPESTSDDRVSSEAKIQIYLSNLPTQLTTKEFNTIMQSVPGLSSWKLMVNQTGSCRGYGFCELNPHSDGELAIELLSRMSIHGKPIFAKFSNSGISGPNYAQQSVKNNNYILTSDLLNPSNKSKEQVQTCTTDSQMATRTQRLMEEKGPSGVGRALSKEVYIVDQTSKVPPQALQHLEKQTGNGCSSMGESILEAIKKATIERSKSSRRSKKVSRRERKIIDDESRRDFHHHVGKVQPITIKPEWASELKCLEASLAALKKVL